MIKNIQKRYFITFENRSLSMILFFKASTGQINWKRGTPVRDNFEYNLKVNLIGNDIKQTGQKRHLTQEESGKLISVQKAQISGLDSNASNVTIETLMKVFTAMKANVNFQIELSPGQNIST